MNYLGILFKESLALFDYFRNVLYFYNITGHSILIIILQAIQNSWF